MKNLLVGIIMVLLATSFDANAHPIKIYGHRGARGLAPENTLPAYKEGLAIGIDYVDMDVNMTKDGVVVVTHNYGLNPDLTRDKKEQWIDPDKLILIKDLTFKQLQQYDVGKLNPDRFYSYDFPKQKSKDETRISSLKQVIQYVNKVTDNKVNFQVELKTDPRHPEWTVSPEKLALATVKILKEEGVADRTEVQAFDWCCLLTVQKADPKIATAYLTDADKEIAMTSLDPKIAGLWTAGYLVND
jgi:glycerophosphoryl diester phosphodiesterase